jgi:glycosyltransferase involved in cell wall biosynthesis
MALPKKGGRSTIRLKKTADDRRGPRIAWLLPTMSTGYYLQPLFREFARLFPNTFIFTSQWPGFIVGHKGKFEVSVVPGFRRVTLRKSPVGTEIGFGWGLPSVLWKLLKFHPDVVFTGSFSLWTFYGLVYKAFTRSRVVLLLEGISEGTAFINSRLRLITRRLMARFLDAAVCNSYEGTRYLRDVIGIPESRLLHQAFFVPEPAALSSTNAGRSELVTYPRPVFLFVGQIIKRKGWNYLVEAAASLAQKSVGSFSVAVVGDGEQKGELKAKISALGIPDVVHVMGPVPYQLLGPHFEAADVFVLPTLEDTWGMVVSEAMSFGKAVLCSKYAGASELVQHGVNGFVFDPHNTGELANYMERLIREPGLIAEFAQRSQQIMAAHTPEKAAQILATLVYGPPQTGIPEVQP